MRAIKYFSITVLGTLIASTAFASHHNTSEQNSNSASATNGWYVGALIGGGSEFLGSDSTSGTGVSDSNNGFAAGMNVGYQFLPNWAAEVGATYLPSQSLDTAISSGSNDYYLFDVAAKYIYAINDKVGLFGKLGLGIQHDGGSVTIGSISGSGSDTEAALYLGAGATYALSSHLQLVADLSSSIGSDWNSLTYMGGVNYLF